MPYLGHEQIAVSTSVLTVASFTIPAKTIHIELMAGGANAVRYTMDDSNNPTVTSGMLLRVTDPPKSFEVADVKRIRFIRDAAADTTLEVHYFTARDIT